MIFSCFTRENKTKNEDTEENGSARNTADSNVSNEKEEKETKAQALTKREKEKVEISTVPLGNKIQRSKTKIPNGELYYYDDILYEEKEENLESKAWTRKQWLKVLKNDDLENTSTSEMLNSLRYGMPEDLRPQVWEFLTQIKELKNEHKDVTYELLWQTPNEKYDEQIKKDINRTCTDHGYFADKGEGQLVLERILRAYANLDPEIGYTQGMNYIAGNLILIMNPDNYSDSNLDYFKTYRENWEEKTFWIFTHIFLVKNYRVIFKNEFPKLMGMMKSFEGRLKDKAPEVFKYLNLVQLDVFLCFHKMFLALLLYNNPMEVNQRILDLFFVESEKILFKILIRGVNICKNEILKLTETDTLSKFLQEDLFNTCFKKCYKKLHLLFPASESVM